MLQEGGRKHASLQRKVPLQPFVCSVPGDLQQERDYLRTQVFPQLDTLCRTRGTCFKAVDLQWRDGAEATAGSEAEVRSPSQPQHRYDLSSQKLKIGLDCIGRSPFFLCILGHRYGQCRPENSPPLPVTGGEWKGLTAVEKNLYVASRNGYPWVLQDKNQTCSLTELEITQALLSEGPRASFFYFRDYSFQEEEGHISAEEQRALLLRVWSSQTEYERRRVRELKTRIVDSCLPVRFFRSLRELEDLVRADWIHVIDQLYPLDVHSTSVLGQQGSFEHWCNESRVEECCRWGCGKTSLAAWWLREFRKKNPEILVIPQFPGYCSYSNDVRSLLRRCTSLLRQAHYGAQAEWSERMEERVDLGPLTQVVQAFSAAAALGPCVLILDGLDQLTETLGLSTQQVKELKWLPETLPVTTPGPALQGVPTSVLQSIVGKKTGLLPAFLAILGCELRTCGVLREEGEEEGLIEQYLEAESLAELWALVILRWINDYSWCVQTKPKKRGTDPPPHAPKMELRGWVWDALCLLHLSCSGLSEEEILSLLEYLGYREALQVSPQDWALFRSAAGPWLQERPDGQLTFTHQSLGQAMDFLFLRQGGKSRTAYRRALVHVFRRRGCSIANRTRALEEVPWSLEQSKALGKLHTFLTDPKTVEFLMKSPAKRQLKADMVRYWALLTQVGYSPLTSYQSLPIQLHRHDSGGPRDTVTGDVGPGEERTAVGRALITEAEGNGGEVNGLQEPEVKGRLMAFSAEILFCLGKILEAEQALLQAEDFFKQAIKLEKGTTDLLLNTQCGLAELLVHMHQPHRAEMYYRRALDTAQALTTAYPDGTEHVQQTRGHLLCMLCRLLLGRGHTDEVPKILREIRAVNHPSTHPCAEATVKLLQGIYEMGHGDVAAAENCFRVALASRRRWYGTEHELVAEVEEYLAGALEQTCRETEGEAVQLYQHVLQVKEQEVWLHAPTSPLAQPIGCSLAATLLKLGKLLLVSSSQVERREAVNLLERAFDLRVRLLGPDHQLTRETAQTLSVEIAGLRKPSISLLPGSTHSPEGKQTAKGTINSPNNHRLSLPEDRSSYLSVRRAHTRTSYRAQDQESLVQIPLTSCQTSVFGPRSSISDLDPEPRAGPSDRARVLHKSAWYHLPGCNGTVSTVMLVHPQSCKFPKMD
ncbi:hypothetical protein AGOR_G00247810 [Albula goreensis]|uniref:Tetratricopeptide repeat protein GNN-like n=1 Tax=Albula goreensis TaxID=1534307 RepID=A0A8T3CE74_9TELE|nr:hypothetical protein AGOR_G00247810 [Albula goreensis]